jgi:hypothetical protein
LQKERKKDRKKKIYCPKGQMLKVMNIEVIQGNKGKLYKFKAKHIDELYQVMIDERFKEIMNNDNI